MGSLKDLENRINKLEQRNKRVESNKAWETSFMRRILLIFFTYLAIAVYMYSVNLPDPWLNALVPAVAFMLSTLTLPFFRNLWIKYIKK